MGDPEAVRDFPEEDQRFAFCVAQWEDQDEADAAREGGPHGGPGLPCSQDGPSNRTQSETEPMATKDLQMIPGRFEIKAIDPEEREFEGDLSTSHLDLGDGWVRDIVWPGAFKRTKDHFDQATDPYIPLLDSHDRFSIFSVLGHLLEMEENLTGRTLEYELEDDEILAVPEMKLWTRWKVIEGEDGDRVLNRLRPGSARNMSMGYRPVKFDFANLASGERLRNLREVKLKEGSLVVFGMNPEASVDLSTVKTFLDSFEGAKDHSGSEIAELRTLYSRIGSLLTSFEKADGPEEEEGPDAERIQGILDRITRLKAEDLATRIDAARLGSAPGTLH